MAGIEKGTKGEAGVEELQILQASITYPMYGNKHNYPYGKLYVTDGVIRKWVELKEDSIRGNYITLNRKRYYVQDIGRYAMPKFVLDIEKTKSYRADRV